ncbi:MULTISPECIES: tRNA glutamyl-Q(34) synthetase GluQRS [Methylomicrobium]|uniref:Glutamyl-Q tRNA(Asp) synthetase n=1 Tax=Methylomicrobium album BG8 TaxID=686340 RepID=H8GHA6_METAL|nr:MULTISPECIES: tRNA glutamyl-Q(34) synthetase GluQRS [Methylomicrobium]EIC28897.1 glutamyl-queuosine tRNA(Asp) synthetase [Methylomicrobium album BG8]
MAGGKPYVGRFAPSPTGPLHLGSLYTALASYLDARAHRGRWLLRIDDIDTPRNVPGSVDSILTTLEAYGLYWDGPVYYESEHPADYEQALSELQRPGLLYPCTCSRKTLAERPGRHDIYPGICRNRTVFPTDRPYALRVKSDGRDIGFDDRLQGSIRQNLAEEHGDFILKRKEGIMSYQFACVIDDHLQGVTHVVRGFDLVDSTPKQIYLQQLLGLPRPSYLHVPIIIDSHGCKLSKQTLAEAVTMRNTSAVMFRLLELLKQEPPVGLRDASCSEMLEWAVRNWNPEPLIKIHAIQPEMIEESVDSGEG